MKTTLLFIFWLSIFCSPVYGDDNIPQHLLGVSKEDIKNEGWRVGTTKRYDTFEQFFKKYENKPSYRSGYVYDLLNYKFLSSEDAIKAVPKLKQVISKRKSEMSVSAKELVEFAHIKLPESPDVRYIYLYFDEPFEEGNDSLYAYIRHSESHKYLEQGRARRVLASELLKQQKNIPGYLVKIPITGIKFQKF